MTSTGDHGGESQRENGQAGLADILNSVAAGSPEALRRLYESTSSKLFGTCLRILNDRAEAEDLLQEVYITVWRRAAQFDSSRGSPIAWLVTIARNRAIDRHRSRRSVDYDTVESIEDMPDPGLLADSAIESAEDRELLSRSLGTLETTHAEAILHIYQDGLTYVEAAERMNVPVGTLKSWVRRGLLKLRISLQQ